MAKQSVVGLGDDINFDPSLQTDEVDHDFFDNPAPIINNDPIVVVEQELPPSQQQQQSSQNNSPFRRLLIETDCTTTTRSNTEEQLSPPTSQQIFSTGTLLACLNNSQNELTIELNNDEQQQQYNSTNTSHRHREEDSSESYRSLNHSKKRAKCPETRIKLFDLSDSSSEDEQGSDEELNNFLEKHHDFLDVADSDFSDITEVSPMSSLAASPFGIEHCQHSDDSNHSIPSANNLLSIVQQSQRMNPSNGTEFCSCQSDLIPVIGSSSSTTTTTTTNNLLKPTPIKTTISAENLPTQKSSFIGVFDEDDNETKDQNQNGERSPSNSSCISSACGSANSTHNTCSSSLSFSFPSSINSPTSRRHGGARSGCSSSASSSSSMGPKKTVRNHSFTPDQLRKIEMENGILLKKILDTQRHHHHHHHHHHHSAGVRGSRNGSFQTRSLTQCSATITRQKQQKRIDYENSLLMKRLQTVKPSHIIAENFSKANDEKMKNDAFKANNNV